MDGQASRPQRAISIAARSAEQEGHLYVDQVVSKRLGGRALWVLAETQVVAETQEWVSDDAEPWRTECKGSNKRFNSWRRCRFNKHKPNSSCVKHVRQQRRRRRPRQRQGKESEQAKVVSQGAQAAVVPLGLESIRACLVDLTPSMDPSPSGVIGAR